VNVYLERSHGMRILILILTFIDERRQNRLGKLFVNTVDRRGERGERGFSQAIVWSSSIHFPSKVAPFWLQAVGEVPTADVQLSSLRLYSAFNPTLYS
jgi:hypothetical protein